LCDFARYLLHIFTVARQWNHLELGLGSRVIVFSIDLNVVLRYDFTRRHILPRHCFPQRIKLKLSFPVIFVIFKVVLI